MKSAPRRMTPPILLCALLTVAPVFGATLDVPSEEHPTIQTGILNAVTGDTVLVACGDYAERDILLRKDITLLSQTGEADCVRIDADGLGQVLDCDSLSVDARIQGFTFINGQDPIGGAVSLSRSSPHISHCAFLGSEATKGGGLACVNASSPLIEHCLFAGNTASNSGGGIYCNALSNPQLSHCTIAENWAYFGGGVYLDVNCQLELSWSIIVDSGNGEAVGCGALSGATLLCCDLFNNADGEWVGCVAGQDAESDNISVDPLFCGVPGSGNYFLRNDSPCSGAINDCRVDLGALPVGCGDTSLRAVNWGAVKRLY